MEKSASSFLSDLVSMALSQGCFAKLFSVENGHCLVSICPRFFSLHVLLVILFRAIRRGKGPFRFEILRLTDFSFTISGSVVADLKC